MKALYKGLVIAGMMFGARLVIIRIWLPQIRLTMTQFTVRFLLWNKL